MSGETIERARGRWREILPALGIEMRFLVNKHGPCPICGGKDRFRFDDQDGAGTFYCNQCGAGTGGMLLRKRHGWDFATLCREIDRVIGRDAPVRRPEPVRQDTGETKRRSAIERLLRGARDHGVVDRYLRSRGISIRSDVLVGHSACPYFDEDRHLVGNYPAVLAPISGPDGSLQSVQRIYIADLSPRKKAMAPIQTFSGGAVRLMTHQDTLGIAEGVETASAASQLYGIPTWAALSAGNLEAFIPPMGVLKLHILADNDANYAGQAAAYVLARRLARDRREIHVRVHVPPGTDTDWNDVLRADRGVAA